MRIFTLRTVDRAVAQTKMAFGSWKAQGRDVIYRRFNPQATYIVFEACNAKGQWQGAIDAQDWLAYFSPSLAALALSGMDAQQILALFTATPQPFSLNIADLSYDSIHVQGVRTGEQLTTDPFIWFRAADTYIALLSLPKLDSKQVSDKWFDATSSLPLPLQFELGRSIVNLAMLSQVSVGDVLLITEEIPRVKTCGVILGRYLLTEEGITMENIDDEFDDAYDDEEETSSFSRSEAIDSKPAALSRVPIKLEFILQEKTLTVAELGQFYQGQLLAFDPASEANIIIRANGVLLAKGELVQLEDRLGVEITTIYSGAQNVE